MRAGKQEYGDPDGQQVPPSLNRRSFLAGTVRSAGVASAGLAAGGLGPLLAACGSSAPTGLANLPAPNGPHNPVLWPISPANGRIADGLPPERQATLRIFTWPGKVGRRCLEGFATAYGCAVEVTTFATISGALAALAKPPVRFDVFLGAPLSVVGSLITGKLIQPLNHSYLPNHVNLWPRFSSPYYDVHLRYTIPYTVYTTGIAWRKDLVPDDPYASAAGWAFPWQAKYLGQVAILDDYRESLSLGMLSGGSTDLDTPDPRLIDAGQQALLALADLVKVRIDNNVADGLASGRTPIHHAWSGQVIQAASRLPAGSSRDRIGYWFPLDGVGPIGSDTGTILRGARNPVLAHLLLNYLLDPVNAVTNMRGNGYQQPLIGLSPAELIGAGALPRGLISAAVLPTFYDNGLKELQLPGPVDQLWRQAWDAVGRSPAARHDAQTAMSTWIVTPPPPPRPRAARRRKHRKSRRSRNG